MLEKPYYEMIRDIESDLEIKRLAEKEASVPLHSLILVVAILTDIGYRHFNADEPQTETTLWTDRYRPKKFVDLLGDEVGTSP